MAKREDTDEEMQTMRELEGHRDSLRRLREHHPIDQPTFTADWGRAQRTMTWLGGEIERLEGLLYQIQTGKLAKKHRGECLREMMA